MGDLLQALCPYDENNLCGRGDYYIYVELEQLFMATCHITVPGEPDGAIAYIKSWIELFSGLWNDHDRYCDRYLADGADLLFHAKALRCRDARFSKMMSKECGNNEKTLTTPTLEWLSDPRVFGVNRLPAHSDHIYYETLEEAKSGVSMSMRYELNGNWKFHYAVNPASRPAKFYQLDFDCSNWGDISVPGHIQLQGYGTPQYVNTMYPWDGHCDVRPPEVPMDYNPVGSYIKTF